MRGLARKLAAPTPGPDWLRQGEVVSVEVGTITITIGGGSDEIAGVSYLGSAPTAGDVVWIAVKGPMLLVLGVQGS